MSNPTASAPILGLDLGTSTCEACVIHQGQPKFIRPDLFYLPPGSNLTLQGYQGVVMPSAFCLRDGEPLVGHRALNELTDPHHKHNVVQAVKQVMYMDGSYPIRLGDRTYSPSEITGEYVKVLRRAAEIELDLPPGTIQRAVVTIPTDFGAQAQRATKKACLDHAGLHRVWFIDEPVAAAYSLRLHERPGKQRVLVVDLGGGTFDVTLLRVGQAAGPHGFEELGRDGDSRLGGTYWDREVADWALFEALPEADPDLRQRVMTDLSDLGHTMLFRASEKAKLDFFEGMERNGLADPGRPLEPGLLSRLRLRSLVLEPNGRPLSAEMPGRVFLENTERLVEQCAHVCERLFHDVKALEGLDHFGWPDIDAIYMAGGGSQMATVQRRFHQRWGRRPILDDFPQGSVAKGAALCGEEIRQGRDLTGIVGKIRYNRTIGLLLQPRGADNGRKIFRPIIPRNQELPFDRTASFLVQGNPAQRKLWVRIGEQEYHHDGPAYEEVALLAIDDLPPPPGGEDHAVVSVQCGQDFAPTFQLQFRGKTVRVDLNDLLPSPNLGPDRKDPGAGPAPGDPSGAEAR